MTVKEKRNNYTNGQYERAVKARKLYHNLGAPMVENYKKIIRANMIRICPVKDKDIEIAEDIWGKISHT